MAETSIETQQGSGWIDRVSLDRPPGQRPPMAYIHFQPQWEGQAESLCQMMGMAYPFEHENSGRCSSEHEGNPILRCAGSGELRPCCTGNFAEGPAGACATSRGHCQARYPMTSVSIEGMCPLKTCAGAAVLQDCHVG